MASIKINNEYTEISKAERIQNEEVIEE